MDLHRQVQRGVPALDSASVVAPTERRIPGWILATAHKLVRVIHAGLHDRPYTDPGIDDEALVVDAWVGVRPVGPQHGVDHAQQLVGGGEDGSLVAEAAGQCAVIAVELRAGGPTLQSTERPIERRDCPRGAATP